MRRKINQLKLMQMLELVDKNGKSYYNYFRCSKSQVET